MIAIVALFCLVALSEAKVPFTYSTIYDELDLNGVKEIGLESCVIGGCSVYISVPKWNVEVTRNIFVYGKATKSNSSLYSFATENDAITGAKTGLHLSNTEYSIMNYNTKDVGPIVIYVVGVQASFYQSAEVEIYDASNIVNRPAKNKRMTMIMSAEPFNIYVQAFGNNLNAIVRTTGFDNNFQRESPNECRIIYEQNEGKPFRLRINSPVVTINFDGQFNYQICAKIDQYNGALLDYPGVATSQGYIGCSQNYLQTYRSSLYTSSLFELKDDQNTERNTELNYVVNTKNTDKVSFTSFYNGGTHPFDIASDGTNAINQTEKAYKINIVLDNKNYGSSYWVGYTPKTGGVPIPSGQGVCTDFTQTTVTGVSQTTSTQPSTTSASNELFTALVSSPLVFLFARIF